MDVPELEMTSWRANEICGLEMGDEEVVKNPTVDYAFWWRDGQ